MTKSGPLSKTTRATILGLANNEAFRITEIDMGLEIFKKQKTNFISLAEKLDLNTSLGHVVFVIISAIAQLERDLIAERVRNGLANARAKGKRIGRLKVRDSALIRSLRNVGHSYREVARIANCSHGSVHAEVVEMRKEQAASAADAINIGMPSEPAQHPPSQ